MEPTPGELVIVTGMTGAGRSTAAKELEDLGYFVVDNLPPTLVRDVVRLVDDSRGIHQPIAVVVDVRSGSFFDSLQANRHQQVTGRPTTLLFLEATEEVLVRRQEAARRPHPLQGGGRLLHGLQRERGVMADIRGDADVLLDTSNFNVHQLQDRIAELFGTAATTRLKVTVISFGFKYGIPVDADWVADMRFLPNPHWVPELRPQNGRDPEVSDYVLSQPGAGRFLEQYLPVLKTVAEGYLARGQAVHAGRHRLHGRQAPQRRDDRGDRRAASASPATTSAPPTATSAGSDVARDTAQAAVALGGGHGLFATLSALRRLHDDLTIDDLTAVVTVADNGGSSGRLRGEFGVLPPGDLRMALAALCGDDEWGRTWADVLQHRFAGQGEMNGHVVGNLLIVGLWELMGEPVRALDWVGRLLGAHGRVLPMATTPMDITARVRGAEEADPEAVTVVRGQVEVATTGGRIESVALVPEDPQACAEAVDAILAAEWVVLGPGSWFSSVIPHLMVPGLRRALAETAGRLVVVLNLEAQAGETTGFGPADHLAALFEHAPDLTVHAVLVDASAIADDQARLEKDVADRGARLVVADIAVPGEPRHDPDRLAEAFRQVVDEA